ncbi:MAG: tetratricopeptide repeat protein [Streptosporangiales bacterium]|nr:tetratricopeptide repeat protein [Streptosporangiales bacterium]
MTGQSPARPPHPAAPPAEPNRFIGHEQDVAEIRALLGTARLVTLCAPGGMGKSRLALHLGREVAAEPDAAVRLVELADLTEPGQVALRVAERLRVPREPGRELTAVVADALRPGRTLLILDNCEHLPDPVAGLADRLLSACPELRILATSREPLRVTGENVYRVPPPTVPRETDGPAEAMASEAVRLFADRAAATRPGFRITEDTLPDVVALCRALDGLPLAIELAAARVSALSPREITERLDRRFELLTTGDRTAPPRRRTLRAAVDWSHDLLSPREQVLLRRLSVWPGGSTLADVEAVCGDGDLPREDVLDLLTRLVEKSLVIREPGVHGESRYRTLETIRHYAAEKLESAGEAERIRRRLRDHIVAWAEDAIGRAVLNRGHADWAERAAIIERARYDGANGDAALDLSWRYGEAEPGLRLCVATFLLWLGGGEFAKGAAWLDRFLALEDPRVPPGLHGRALLARAYLTFEPGEPAGADTEAMLRDGIRLCERAGDAWGATAGQGGLGFVRLRGGDAAGAIEIFRAGLAAARRAEDPLLQALHLGGLGGSHIYQGDFAEARRYLERGADLTRRQDFRWGTSLLLTTLGTLARLQEDPETARRCLEESLPLLRDIESPPPLARCLVALGELAVAQGRLEAAYGHLTEALRINRRTGHRHGTIRTFRAFVSLASARGAYRTAVRLAGACSALHEGRYGGNVEELLGAARRRLGGEVTERLLREGRMLGTEAAVELALRETRERTVPEPRAPESDGPRDAEPRAPRPRDGTAVPGGASRSAGGAGATSRGAALAGDGADGAGAGVLTAREREIAALVARGLSNRGIADELVISPATAARHVANILAKLGFSSRTQIAAWVTRTGDSG